MSTYTAIDLSRLPPPDVIETLDAEALLAAIKADLLARSPDLAPVLALESEPLVKFCEVLAYRETLTRARINDEARALLLALASGSTLEHLGVIFNVARREVFPATEDAPAVMEGDASLRARIQLAPEAFTVAGSRGSYRFHCLSVPGVKDVSVTQPFPGVVRVFVLSATGDGTVTQDLLDQVGVALDPETVIPMSDTVEIVGARVWPYQVTATLTMLAGPSPEVVLANARAAVAAYVVETHQMGRALRLSGILGALHQPGVERVDLVSPTADIVPGADGAPFCTAITVGVTA